jgi:hypothetical protein
MYDGVVTGIADMGMSHISYTRGRFPVTEVFDNPLGFPNGWVSSQVVSDFYEKFHPKEWNEVHPLYINTSGPLLILTVSKAIKTLEDMKGVKIRATGQIRKSSRHWADSYTWNARCLRIDAAPGHRRDDQRSLDVEILEIRGSEQVRHGLLAARHRLHLLLHRGQGQVERPAGGHTKIFTGGR